MLPIPRTMLLSTALLLLLPGAAPPVAANHDCGSAYALFPQADAFLDTVVAGEPHYWRAQVGSVINVVAWNTVATSVRTYSDNTCGTETTSIDCIAEETVTNCFVAAGEVISVSTTGFASEYAITTTEADFV